MTRRSIFKWLAAVIGIRGREAASKPRTRGDVDDRLQSYTIPYGTAEGNFYYFPGHSCWWIAGEPDLYSFEDGEPI